MKFSSRTLFSILIIAVVGSALLSFYGSIINPNFPIINTEAEAPLEETVDL